MTPTEAAQKLAFTMNEIEKAGYFLYPHPRPVGISIRVQKDPAIPPDHPEKTRPVAIVWDEGDGRGWRVKA